LEIIDPNGDPDDPANWRPSVQPGGSPRAPNPTLSLPVVRLNEVMAGNRGVVTNLSTTPDWIELYNAGPAPVDLTSWVLADGPGTNRFYFPAGMRLAGGGYLIVWCDDRLGGEPGLHTGFALNRAGETLVLLDHQDNRVDAVTFGLQTANFSLGRYGPDAGWYLNEPTPGGVNHLAQLASPTNVLINEFLANALPGGDDWIELFNLSTNLPVSLRGLSIGTSNALFQISAHIFIPPSGFALLHADENPGPNHVDFKLPAARGAIILYDQNGAELNRVTYSNALEGVSQGRLPDGLASITSFPNSASPSAPNYVAAYTGAVLNEVMARNESALASSSERIANWVELLNPNATAFNLTGMSLSLGELKPHQWVFPAGASVPSQGYLLVWCDGSRPGSTNLEANLNCGHSLAGEGGSVCLFNAAGQLVDLIEFGFQLPGQSIGRSGGSWALLSQPTPGAANAAPAPLGSPANLRLNEWLASAAGDDWLELFNLDPLPVDMSGLTLTDDPSIAGQTNHVIGALTFIAGRGWVKWVADGEVVKGHNHLAFRLDALGETLRLYDRNRNVLDNVDLLVQQPGVSQGRFPDGATNIVSFPETSSPGAANFMAARDTDGDGLPDDWELVHGLNPILGSGSEGATGDPDGDGLTNLQECLAGTDPARLTVMFLSAFTAVDGLHLSFNGVAGQSYTVEYRDSLTDGPWQALTNIAALPSTGVKEMILRVPAGVNERYFRLVMAGRP
jgi:hypothetical protein